MDIEKELPQEEVWKSCEWCCKEFVPRNVGDRFCSSRCASEHAGFIWDTNHTPG